MIGQGGGQRKRYSESGERVLLEARLKDCALVPKRPRKKRAKVQKTKKAGKRRRGSVLEGGGSAEPSSTLCFLGSQ